MFWEKKTKDHRDIDQIVFDIAESQQDKDYIALYKSLPNTQLYMPIVPESLPHGSTEAQEILTDKNSQIKTRKIIGPND